MRSVMRGHTIIYSSHLQLFGHNSYPGSPHIAFEVLSLLSFAEVPNLIDNSANHVNIYGHFLPDFNCFIVCFLVLIIQLAELQERDTIFLIMNPPV